MLTLFNSYMYKFRDGLFHLSGKLRKGYGIMGYGLWDIGYDHGKRHCIAWVGFSFRRLSLLYFILYTAPSGFLLYTYLYLYLYLYLVFVSLLCIRSYMLYLYLHVGFLLTFMMQLLLPTKLDK
jgi:hypothetical protein